MSSISFFSNVRVSLALVAAPVILVATTVGSLASSNICPANYTPQYTSPGSILVYDTPQPGGTCFCSPNPGNNGDIVSCFGNGKPNFENPVIREITIKRFGGSDHDWDEYTMNKAANNPYVTPYTPGVTFLGGPRDAKPFEMHLLPGTTLSSAPAEQSYGSGNTLSGTATVFGASHSGFNFTDQTGASGQSASFRDSGGQAGVGASLEARKLFGLTANQSLIIGADVSYLNANRSFALDVASIKSETIGGSVYARYAANDYYVRADVGFGWGRNDIVDQSSGTPVSSNYGSNDFSSELRFGKIIPLWNNSGLGGVKDGGVQATRSLVADLSGHIGYSTGTADGYTDASGAVFGNETERYWDAGGSARLVYFAFADGILWAPFVGVSFDRQFGYSHTGNISGDQFQLKQDASFGGVETGIKAKMRDGSILGLTGSYEGSGDQHYTGATFSVKVPY